jgi:hypothetical protein
MKPPQEIAGFDVATVAGIAEFVSREGAIRGENLVFAPAITLDRVPDLACAFFDRAVRGFIAMVSDPLSHGSHDIGLGLELQFAAKILETHVDQ